MKFFANLQNIDRRILYVIIAVVIIFATVKPMGLPIEVGAQTQTAYDFVAQLPAGSRVVFMFNYDAAGAPELLPASIAMIHHMLDANQKVICLGMWNQAGSMANLALTQIAKDCPDKKYGEDYVNVGFRVGQIVWEGQAVADLASAMGASDVNGDSLANMPIMQGIKTANDTALWVDMGAGDPGYKATVATIGAAGVPIITGVTAVSVAEAMPYYQAGQIRGLIMGMRGAAEYELLAQAPGKAIAGMDAQSLSHVLIILFIVMGNLGYFASRGAKNAKR